MTEDTEGELPSYLPPDRQRELFMANHTVEMACAVRGHKDFLDLLAKYDQMEMGRVLFGSCGCKRGQIKGILG